MEPAGRVGSSRPRAAGHPMVGNHMMHEAAEESRSLLAEAASLAKVAGMTAEFVKHHRAFHLRRDAKAVLSPDMELVIAPFVVGEWRSQLDPALASHHHQLGKLLLDDEALLDEADMHDAHSGGLPEGPLGTLPEENQYFHHAAAQFVAESADHLRWSRLFQRDL